jgi:OOP family OmpA-OmpF porin
MGDGLKIAIGAAGTAVLALVLHGPLGQGAAYQARLAPHGQTPMLAQAEHSVQAAINAAPANDMAVMASAAASSPAKAPIPAPSPKASAAAAPAARPVPSPTAKAAPVPVAVAAPAPAGSCQNGVDAAVAGRVMSFQSGSAWLNPTSQAIIRDVASALRRCDGYHVEIAGHTDGTGDEWINRTMSQERATRVRDALVARGISASLVSAKGYGSSRPVRAGDLANPANRRITFTVTQGGA